MDWLTIVALTGGVAGCIIFAGWVSNQLYNQLIESEPLHTLTRLDLEKIVWRKRPVHPNPSFVKEALTEESQEEESE